ncbi:TrkH family potassium uptake protein [Enterococcus pallens]|uniref:TrkH family potassium uptake protein n=1 Tax=Enterococcus pallens ATCC BAA-351 TaxID=1158607 RepID=R2QI29_9ENTE|nr:TrkH family potassium uptake protein [Enterococcus pallens]EOH96252.1 TrkH family potassium uptake protein [Enterococcus pallens ATCC BAA-351]EOU14535.1 trk system potassium uptake protein TrkH [Enterococcus pallens ATCC BAA-351]OJG80974.1 TrkH family potassium uptake protein [Enterococcus pallens]
MDIKDKLTKFRLHPLQFLALGFMLVILTGALLLSLPISSNSGEATNFIDALFTATSATCVTGLTTLTTIEHWNFFGQAVILTMIELGGLGFMMMPILFFTVFRKKVGLKTRIVLQEALNLEAMSGVMDLMVYILRLATIIQCIGAVLLAIHFIPEYGWRLGAWYAVFHSVSAFCNAGFDLFGDSLVSFQSNPYVLLVISSLIVAGGLGFYVWKDIISFPKRRKLSLHSKIALGMTFILLVGGTLLFYITEHNAYSLAAGSNGMERFANTIFMAVTPRTAGYFSIDYLRMSQAGILLTIILMFIGGTSGSTAGGLKTTTLAVLIIQTISMLKGRQHAELKGRTIRSATVFRAMSLFFITLSLCVASTMILSITEAIPETSGIEYIAFEVVSAFATVGLTMGLTPDLTLFGKLLIILLMYVGRVGILTVGFSISMRLAQDKSHGTYKYPEETVIVG